MGFAGMFQNIVQAMVDNARKAFRIGIEEAPMSPTGQARITYSPGSLNLKYSPWSRSSRETNKNNTRRMDYETHGSYRCLVEQGAVSHSPQPCCNPMDDGAPAWNTAGILDRYDAPCRSRSRRAATADPHFERQYLYHRHLHPGDEQRRQDDRHHHRFRIFSAFPGWADDRAGMVLIHLRDRGI